MRRALGVLILGMIIPAASAMASPAGGPLPFSFGVHPGAFVPLGPDAAIFGVGGGAEITADYSLEPFFLRAGLDYSYDPAKSVTSISVLSLGVGGGVRITPLRAVSLGVYGEGGYFFSFLNDASVLASHPNDPSMGTNPFVAAGFVADWRIIPSLSIGIDASYRTWLGLSQGICASLGATWHLVPLAEQPASAPRAPQGPPQVKPKPLEKTNQAPSVPNPLALSDVNLDPLFPVLYAYYDDHPVGHATLKNVGTEPITGVSVTLYAKQYMDDPKPCGAPETIGPGESADVVLRALLNRQVLGVTESTKASARIQVSYTCGGEAKSFDAFQTLVIEDRNGIVWTDDRRAAAFVNPRDPDVLSFSHIVSAAARDTTGAQALPVLLGTLATHEAVRLHGVRYAVDPTSPYAEFSKNKLAVDFLEFPRQTLESRSGDCDDLSILYASVLEAQGIDAAFITTPGHIFVAVDLRMSREDAVRQFSQPGDLIFSGGKTWLPLEVTALGSGFLDAWRIAAREWREGDSRKDAKLIPIAEAWTEYKPTGFDSSGTRLALPPSADVASAVKAETDRFIDREIGSRAALLSAEFKKSGSPKSMNSLGVLYARFGINDKAETSFRSALSRDKKHLPALVNLAHLLLVTGRTRDALQSFRQAESIDSSNPSVVLGLAVANYRMENYGEARSYYDQLRVSDPAVAQRYAFLDMQGQEAAARAAEATQDRGVIPWQD